MINHITAKAGERAGIKNPKPRLKHINPHIFRHSIARYLKNKGFSVEWIQNFFGACVL
ncbi:MAG: site-specific integrase, partial [bacterium]